MSTTDKSFTAAAPKVKECTCEHEYQDKRYGKFKRLMNPANNKKYRCTVCGRLHD